MFNDPTDHERDVWCRGELLLADGRWNKTAAQILIRAEARSFVEMWEDV